MNLKEWIRGWSKASAKIDELKRRDLCKINTPEAIQSLDQAFRAIKFAPRKSSGLVDFQAILRKIPPS